MFIRIDASGGYLAEVLPAVIVLSLGLATTVAPERATCTPTCFPQASARRWSLPGRSAFSAGALAALTIRKLVPTRAGTLVSSRGDVHCALDAPLLRRTVGESTG